MTTTTLKRGYNTEDYKALCDLAEKIASHIAREYRRIVADVQPVGIGAHGAPYLGKPCRTMLVPACWYALHAAEVVAVEVEQ